MSPSSQPVDHVSSLLVDAGYITVEQPLAIEGVQFEFPAMLAGRESLDLIVVLDTLGNRDEESLAAEVEGLSRALDLARSRRPLTAVVVGPTIDAPIRQRLTAVGRVLDVGTPVTDADQGDLQNALAVLLPLRLPRPDRTPHASWDLAKQRFLGDPGHRELASLLKTAGIGASAVQEALRTEILRPLIKLELDDESS